MQQEMYKDAIHFMREARRHHEIPEHDSFVVWRNIRAAILFSFAAIESCINQFIGAYVEENGAKMSPSRVIYWKEAEPQLLSIYTKLNEGIELLGGERLKADKLLSISFEDLRPLTMDPFTTNRQPRSVYHG